MERLFDLIFSLAALFLFLPILILCIVVLRFTGEGEVFFMQERIGYQKSRFKVFKFATMLKNSPNIGSGTITSKDDARILPVGKFLRKTKINEIPQLLNVVLGEMSLIGPRPHASRDLEGLKPSVLDEVCSLKPGLSGIGSVVFRDEEHILQTFEDPRPFYDDVIAPYKAQLEIWYKNNKSIFLYFKLIILTVRQLFFSKKSLPFEVFLDLPSLPAKLKPYF